VPGANAAAAADSADGVPGANAAAAADSADGVPGANAAAAADSATAAASAGRAAVAPPRGGRVKQRAQMRDEPPPTSRPREQTNRYSPPPPATKRRRGAAEAKVVVGRKRAKPAGADAASSSAESPFGGADEDGTVVAYAVPISENSKRVLLGQVSLNKQFKKSYAARDPPKKPPVANWTLGNAFHSVCSPPLHP